MGTISLNITRESIKKKKPTDPKRNINEFRIPIGNCPVSIRGRPRVMQSWAVDQAINWAVDQYANFAPALCWLVDRLASAISNFVGWSTAQSTALFPFLSIVHAVHMRSTGQQTALLPLCYFRWVKKLYQSFFNIFFPIRGASGKKLGTKSPTRRMASCPNGQVAVC